MSTARPWYKRYPAQFISGTYRLTAEEKGVYSTLLDLMYDRGGPLEDDAKELSRICGCSTRRFNQIKEALANRHGKLVVKDGLIENPRAVEQMEEEKKEHLKRTESGKKGGEKSAKHHETIKHKSAENQPDLLKSNGLGEKQLSPGLDHKEEEEDSTPPTPPPGGDGEGVQKSQKGESHAAGIAHFAAEDLGNVALWETFKNAWPIGSQLNDQTEKIFEGLDEKDQSEALSGVPGYVKERRENDLKFSARRYLADRGWKGLKPLPGTKDSGPKLPGVVIHPGSEQWEAWDHYLELHDVFQGVSHSQLQNNNQNSRMMRVPSEWPPPPENET